MMEKVALMQANVDKKKKMEENEKNFNPVIAPEIQKLEPKIDKLEPKKLTLMEKIALMQANVDKKKEIEKQ